MDQERLRSLADLSNIELDKLNKLHELAKIETLSEVKSEVVRWVGTWAGTLALITTILAAIGVNELINNRVEDRVRGEIKTLHDEIESAKIEIKVALEQSREQLNEIDSTLQQALALERSFKSKITEIEPLVTEISDLTEQAELKLILDNLISDFYTIKDLKAHVEVHYSEEIDKLRNQYGFRLGHFVISTLDLQIPQDDNASVAQFVAPNEIASLNKTGLSYQMRLFPPFELRLNGKPIDELKSGKIRFRDVYVKQFDAQRKIEASDYMNFVKIRITVNGVPILVKQFNTFEFGKQKDDDGDYLVTSLHELEGELMNPRAAFENGISSRLEQATPN